MPLLLLLEASPPAESSVDWSLLLNQLWEALQEHWAKLLLPLVGLVIGWWWGRRKAKREWNKKQFIRRLNVSLNLLEPNKTTGGPPTLRIRTLLEKDAKDVFLNDVAVEHLVAAANKTKKDDPLLPLGDDSWYMLNAVLNEISEQFAAGFLKSDLGLPTCVGTYIIALTYERDGAMKTQKVRAMVIQKDSLRACLPTRNDETGEKTEPLEPHYERPNHATRWRTLRQLALAWQAEPERFLEMQIVM